MSERYGSIVRRSHSVARNYCPSCSTPQVPGSSSTPKGSGTGRTRRTRDRPAGGLAALDDSSAHPVMIHRSRCSSLQRHGTFLLAFRDSEGLDQLPIHYIGSQQLLMQTLRANLPLLHHDDVIGIDNG
jgi:hypothetical protein